MTQLPCGFYKVTSSANLRWERQHTGEYISLKTLEPGDLVYVTQIRQEVLESRVNRFMAEIPWNPQSYFDGNAPRGLAEGAFRLGGWRTDHSWCLALSTMDYDGDVQEGWITNGKLERVSNEIERLFRNGDVLYGRWEAREPWVQEKTTTERGAIYKSSFNIIDRLNNQILRGNFSRTEVEDFADFLERYTQTARERLPDIAIRKLCKCGLTYITQRGNQVHFVLDGLDPRRVMDEVDVNTLQGVQDVSEGPRKACTGAEMRRLMRQRMHDQNNRDGRDYGIVLGQVTFYLASERIPAPWEQRAPENWRQAWARYLVYRQRKRG